MPGFNPQGFIPLPGAGAGRTLEQSMQAGREFEARGNVLRDQHEQNISNIGGQLQQLRASANSAVQSQGSTNFGGGPRGFDRQLTQAVARGKARQGIYNRGDKAIRNQQLKDRMAIARQSTVRRGQLQQFSADTERVRAGADASIQSASDSTRTALTGAAGSIAGGLVRGFGDKIFSTGDLGQGMADQQFEVDSFFDVTDGGVGGLDNIFSPGFGSPA